MAKGIRATMAQKNLELWRDDFFKDDGWTREARIVDMSQNDGRVLDISNLFYRYTLDVATDFLLGTDVKSLR